MTHIVRFMGSSRYAGFCRSPFRLPWPTLPQGLSRLRGRLALCATMRSDRRWGACSRRTPRLRRPQDLAAATAGRVRRRPLLRCPPDESNGVGRRDLRQSSPELVAGPVRTTINNRAAPCSLDRANRQFRAPAPNILWVSDLLTSRPARGSSTWHSSSTPMLAGSLASAPVGAHMPASSRMRLSRRCTTDDQYGVAV